MKKEFLISYQIFSDKDELSSADKTLLVAAQKAAMLAYAPYSHYPVGAAVLLEKGEIIEGNNQENSVYPEGLCAERVSLFYAHASHPQTAIVAMAVTAIPCGACRQVMVEYENRQKSPIRILFQDTDKNILVFDSAANLLPFAFFL